MKPYVICHMASSLDGRIQPHRWKPAGSYAHGLYDELHARLGGGSWIVGRVTGEEFARATAYPAAPDASFPREPWLPQRAADTFGIVFDTYGKIAWGRADIGGDPIVVVLTETVSDSYLAGLRADGVGYVFAGKESLDLGEALASLHRELSIERLLLEGGGVLNGAFLLGGPG